MSRVCELCGKTTHAGGSISRRGLAKKKGGVGAFIEPTGLLSASSSWGAGTTLDWQLNGSAAVLDLPLRTYSSDAD